MRIWIPLLALAAGCFEPPKHLQMDQATSALTDLYKWDPVMKGAGQIPYDTVVGNFPDSLPFLVDHLTDMRPTALYESTFDIKVTVSDVCFLILLDLLQLPAKEFLKDGVFVSTQLKNPVFCVRFDDMAARHRVKKRFADILAERGYEFE